MSNFLRNNKNTAGRQKFKFLHSTAWIVTTLPFKANLKGDGWIPSAACGLNIVDTDLWRASKGIWLPEQIRTGRHFSRHFVKISGELYNRIFRKYLWVVWPEWSVAEDYQICNLKILVAIYWPFSSLDYYDEVCLLQEKSANHMISGHATSSGYKIYKGIFRWMLYY